MTSPAKQKQKEIKEIAPKTKNFPSIKTEKPKEIDSNASFLKYKHNVLNKRMTDAPSVVSKDYGMEKFNPSREVLTPLNQVGTVDPLTGLPVQKMTNVPPAPSNTLGQAQPVFNQQTQQNAQGIFGGVDQRQNSVGATPLFQKEFQRVQPGLIKQWEPKIEQPVPERVQPELIKQPQQQKKFIKPVLEPNMDQKEYIDTKIEPVKPQRL